MSLSSVGFFLGAWFRVTQAQGEVQSVNLVELEWIASSECPDGASVNERVKELAGAVTRHQPLRAKGTVTVTQSGVTLHLETRDDGETFVRDVVLPTCEQAAEMAALILAMALRAELTSAHGLPAGPTIVPPNPSNGAQPTSAPLMTTVAASTPPPTPTADEPLKPDPPSADLAPSPTSLLPSTPPEGPLALPGPKPEVTAPASPEAPSSDSTAELSDEAPRRRVSIGAGGSAAWGVLPTVLWGLSAHVAWNGDVWRVEAYGVFAPTHRVALSSDNTRGGDFSLWSAGLRGCYLANFAGRDAPFRALGCLGAEGGQIRAEGFGTTLSDQGVSPWWALAGSVGARVALAERVGTLVRVEGMLPLWRDSFVLRTPGASDGRVAQPGYVVGRVGLSLEVVF